MFLTFIFSESLDFSLITNSVVPLSISLRYRKSETQRFTNGPHINPHGLNNLVRIYDNPNYHRNLIGSDNTKHSVIYPWLNLINGKIYVGSAWNGSIRLLSYWTPSILRIKISYVSDY
uniref:GIY-YIG domain-containing protein n=1 Tax=Russula lepida TaxID=152963 RepID=A0A2S0U3W1_9AGAM|nr:hypothetical protein [Russula lepida]AWB36177.1 hypothetical protein [Russula lepida]